MTTANAGATRNPFPGLRPFREDEEHLFFGRELKVDMMVDKLAATRFLAVVGTSGSGKSSLVNCGLRPALHRGLMSSAGSSWRIAQFRPGLDPIGSLAAVLAAKGVLFSDYSGEMPLVEIVRTCLTQSTKGLSDIFRRANLPAGVNLLVVADQFEELFRFRKLGSNGTNGSASACDASEQATAFVSLLLEAHMDPTCPIYVVITMRSDYLGDCSQIHGLPEAINQGQYLVPRLTRDERRASIAGPVGIGGAEINPVLLTRLVNDVGDDPDQLSILQHALNRTWARWELYGAQGPLDLNHYEEIGSMGRALNQHADVAFAALGTRSREKICETIFKALTDIGTDARGIRRPTKLGTLCELVGGQSEAEEVRAVIEVFRDPSRSFLMPPAPEALGPETVIDISHESLMRVWERLRAWTEDEAQSARRFRRLSETAILEADGKARLWRDPDLQLALDWNNEQMPTATWAGFYGGKFEAAMAFLERSRNERDTERANVILNQRWSTRWRRALIALTVVLSAWIHHVKPEQTRAQTLSDKSFLRMFVPEGIWKFFSDAVRELIPLFYYFGLPLIFFLIFDRVGKWIFRQKVFPKVLVEVAASADKARREQKLEKAAITDAAAALHTTYAGFWRRVGAYLLDLAMCAGASAAILAAIFALPHASDWATHSKYSALLFFLPVLVGWMYVTRTVSSHSRATLGMKAMGIFATTRQTDTLSFAGATAWYFSKILSYATLGLGFLAQIWTKRHQTLHDFVSRTAVLTSPDQKKVPSWMGALCSFIAIPAIFFLVTVSILTLGFLVLLVTGIFH